MEFINKTLIKLAESKMINDSIIDFGVSDKDYVDVFFYEGQKKNLKERREEEGNLIDLSRRHFRGCYIETPFVGSSSVSFSDSTLNDCFIVKEKLNNSSFVRTKIIQSSLGKTDFNNSDFSYSFFSKVNIYGAKFTNCKFVNLNSLSEDSFSFGSFYDADWRGTDFTGSNLKWINVDTILSKNYDFFEDCKGLPEDLFKRIHSGMIRKKLF